MLPVVAARRALRLQLPPGRSARLLEEDPWPQESDELTCASAQGNVFEGNHLIGTPLSRLKRNPSPIERLVEVVSVEVNQVSVLCARNSHVRLFSKKRHIAPKCLAHTSEQSRKS